MKEAVIEWRKGLLGAYWSRFFPASEYPQGPLPTTCLPKQACMVTLYALRKLKTTYEEATEAAELAEQGKRAFAMVQAEAKRRRTQVLGVSHSPAA